ncbi:MAG: hypothetical protein QM781_01815 [Chitinophagaceae bacterium]
MKPANYFMGSLLLLLYTPAILSAQATDSFAGPDTIDRVRGTVRHINFFIISKREKGRFDLASRFNVFRSKIKNFFRRKKFVAIVARDAGHMSRKMQRKLNKYKAHIGTLWFDSHGKYKKGYSLFYIGRDEISLHSIYDSTIGKHFRELAAFADTQTRVVIGACYGGATYTRLSVDYKDTTRMNGDSLMRALGSFFHQSVIYGSESWVMTKPGIFLKKAAVVGHPGRKLFRDICYKPVWETVGQWNEYAALSNSFRRVNPLTMDMYGNVLQLPHSFPRHKSDRRGVKRNMKKLKPGLYK